MGLWDTVSGAFGLGTAASGVKKLGNPLDWGKQNPKMQDADFMRDYIKTRLGGLDGRQAPLAGNAARMNAARIDPTQQGQWRGDQRALAAQLQAVANGQQAGAGELAVNRQRQAGIAQQQAAMAAQRGGMAGLAGRTGARNMGTLSTNAAGMAREAAMADQGAARGLLAGVLGQGREQDLGLATSQAGLNQQAGMANQQAQNQFALADQAAKLQQMGMNDQQIAQLLAQLYGMNAAQMQATLSDQGIFGDVLQMGGTLGASWLSRPGGGG